MRCGGLTPCEERRAASSFVPPGAPRCRTGKRAVSFLFPSGGAAFLDAQKSGGKRRVQGGKPFAKGFSPLKIPLFGRPKGACGPLWKPWGCRCPPPRTPVAARKCTDNGCTMQLQCAPTHVGTSRLLETGEIIKRGHNSVSPLNCTFLLPLLFGHSKRNGVPMLFFFRLDFPIEIV